MADRTCATHGVPLDQGAPYCPALRSWRSDRTRDVQLDVDRANKEARAARPSWMFDRSGYKDWSRPVTAGKVR